MNKMKTKLALPLVTLVLAFAGHASAATVIASYNFITDISANTDANTTATDVTRNGFASGGRSSAFLNYFGQGPTVSDGDSYIQFTLTATSGTLNLSQLTFNYGAQGDNNADYNATFAVRTSVDSYVADVATTYSTNPMPDRGNLTRTNESATADLTGAAYQGLSTITFRLYGETDSASASTNEILRWNNIQVTAIPEPSTALFSALGMLALLRRRR